MNLIKTIIISILTVSWSYPANSIVTLFLQKYPTVKHKTEDNAQPPKFSKKLKQPSYLHKQVHKGKKLKTGAPGVLSMYLGYSSVSDENGQISFPRKQQKSQMNILIAKAIHPVFMIAPTTLHHWTVDTNQPAEMYTCSVHLDKQTEMYYIKTEKTALPDDKTIVLNTIIILADPKDIYIPEGATLINYSNNLILPNIYIKPEFDYTFNAIQTTATREYFRKIQRMYKQEEQTNAMIMHT